MSACITLRNIPGDYNEDNSAVSVVLGTAGRLL